MNYQPPGPSTLTISEEARALGQADVRRGDSWWWQAGMDAREAFFAAIRADAVEQMKRGRGV